jgi:hypothetical protein
VSAARQGKTNYFWGDPQNKKGCAGSYPPPPEITNDEYIAALKEKFPDTTVEYQETWIETRRGIKEEMKGINIDWS